MLWGNMYAGFRDSGLEILSFRLVEAVQSIMNNELGKLTLGELEATINITASHCRNFIRRRTTS